MKQEPGKRIVTKSEFVESTWKRISLSVLVFCLFVVMCICLMVAFACFIILIICLLKWHDSTGAEIGLTSFIGLVIFSLFSYLIAKMMRTSFEFASEIDPGIVVTSTNSADLPAPDSLVRASVEPLQAQQAILLRAATEESETQADQLLRATTGGQE